MPAVPRAEIPFREVEQAVRAHVAADSSGVFGAGTETVKAIGAEVGFDQYQVEYRWQARGKGDAFTAQVKHAFDKLAGEGVLRKAGLGTTGPDGREVYRGQIRWYTPAGWDAAARQHAEQVQADAAGLRRARALDARLHGLGLHPELGWYGDVHLGLDDLEYLVTLAEQATGQPPRKAAP